MRNKITIPSDKAQTVVIVGTTATLLDYQEQYYIFVKTIFMLIKSTHTIVSGAHSSNASEIRSGKAKSPGWKQSFSTVSS